MCWFPPGPDTAADNAVCAAPETVHCLSLWLLRLSGRPVSHGFQPKKHPPKGLDLQAPSGVNPVYTAIFPVRWRIFGVVDMW